MAKFCSECGKELEENGIVCKNCGKKVDVIAPQTTVTQTVQAHNKTNGFAIAGFVISLVSLLCCGGTSWLGLIFSIIGLVNANKQNGEGKGLAIAGIVISAILLILLVSLYALGIASSFMDEFHTINYY